MNFELLSIGLAIIIGVVVGIKKREALLGFGVALILNLVITGTFTMLLKHINYDDFQLKLKVSITDDMTNEDIKTKINDLLVESSNGQVFDVVVNIEDENLGNANIKKIDFKAKKGLFNLYTTEKKEFKIVISDVTKINNKLVEINGL